MLLEPPFQAVTLTVAVIESVAGVMPEIARPDGAPLENETVKLPEYPSELLHPTVAEVWLPDTLKDVLLSECVPKLVSLPVTAKLVPVPLTVKPRVSLPQAPPAGTVRESDIFDRVTVLPLRLTLPVSVPMTGEPLQR